MKFKSLVFVCCLGLLSSAFAGNSRHVHPQTNSNDGQKQAQSLKKGAQLPGYCEIEIVNQSGHDIKVYGVFDDRVPLAPFQIYAYEAPHYIDLFYNGYCHAGMDLYIDSWDWPLWYRIYSSWTPVGTSIYAVPYLANQTKIKISKK